MPLIGPRHIWDMLFSAEKSEHLQIEPTTQNLSPSDVFMHGSHSPRVTTHNIWAFKSAAARPGKTTLIIHRDECTDRAKKIGILHRLQRKIRPTALRRIVIGAIRLRLKTQLTKRYACFAWSRENTSRLIKLQELFCRGHKMVFPQLQLRFD